MNRRRHAAFLGTAIASCIATSSWRMAFSPLAAFAFYGALHALTLVAALRGRQTVWRACAFVLAAAGLSAGTAALGFHGMSFVSRVLPGRAGMSVLLGVVAVAGALAYAALIRLFAVSEMSSAAVCAAVLACPLAIFLTMGSGIHASLGAYLSVSIAWWCGFSAALCVFDRGAFAAVESKRL